MNNPNSNVAGDDEAEKLANLLGINLDDNDDGKEEKEPNSKETGTEGTENKQDAKPEKEDVDYKAKYAASTKEFQEKYQPLQEKVAKIEEVTGKKIDDVLDLLSKKEKVVPSKEEGNKSEVDVEKIATLEKEISSIKEKVQDFEFDRQVTVKEKVATFKNKYGISDEEYQKSIVPHLQGIKNMKNADGETYPLEDGLEIAYLAANRGNIDKIVQKKIELEKKNEGLNFSPKGAKLSSEPSKTPYTDAQKEMASKMGIDLDSEQKK